MMTGTSNDGASDWAAIIAGESQISLSLPQMVPPTQLPGRARHVRDSGGDVSRMPCWDALLSGEHAGPEWRSMYAWITSSTRMEDRMDLHPGRRAARDEPAEEGNIGDQGEGTVRDAYEASLIRSCGWKDLREVINWSASGSRTAEGRRRRGGGSLISRTELMNHGDVGVRAATPTTTTPSPRPWESLFEKTARHGGSFLESFEARERQT